MPCQGVRVVPWRLERVDQGATGRAEQQYAVLGVAVYSQVNDGAVGCRPFGARGNHGRRRRDGCRLNGVVHCFSHEEGVADKDRALDAVERRGEVVDHPAVFVEPEYRTGSGRKDVIGAAMECQRVESIEEPTIEIDSRQVLSGSRVQVQREAVPVLCGDERGAVVGEPAKLFAPEVGRNGERVLEGAVGGTDLLDGVRGTAAQVESGNPDEQG